MNKNNMKVVHIDELANVCGYFTTKTDINSGYGCNHPEQECFEIAYQDDEGYTRIEDKEPKVKQGRCHCYSCPLATECNLEDLKKYSPEDYDDWKDHEYDPSESGANLVLVSDKELIEKLEQ